MRLRLIWLIALLSLSLASLALATTEDDQHRDRRLRSNGRGKHAKRRNADRGTRVSSPPTVEPSSMPSTSPTPLLSVADPGDQEEVEDSPSASPVEAATDHEYEESAAEPPTSLDRTEHPESFSMPSTSPTVWNSDLSMNENSTSKFKVEFVFASTVKEEYKTAFELAAARWSSVISKDLPTTMTLPRGQWCGSVFVRNDREIDDLLILVRIFPMDGIGGILGRAGPCLVDSYRIPRFGLMEFDEDDVEVMIATGVFNNVILHEMGHVLGIGTLWDYLDLVDWTRPPSLWYNGVEGNLGNQDIGRTGQAVVENEGAAGTVGGHWKEGGPDGYDTELMTGYAERPGVAMPLSRLTVRALRDLGYFTDPSQADPFNASALHLLEEESSGDQRRRRLGGGKVDLGEDRLQVEIAQIDTDVPKPGREREVAGRRRRKLQRRSQISLT